MPTLRSAIIAALLLAGTAPAAAQGTEALRAAAARFAGIDAICADFRQTMEIQLLRRTKESAGRVCQRTPNFFSMDFSDPEGDAIVADGTDFWVHLPSEQPGQVLRIPMTSRPGGLDFYREFLESPMEKYAVTEAGTEQIGGIATHAVRLVPEQAGEWREATVWIDPASALVRRVRIVENSGSVRTLTLSGIQVNPTLADDFFEFTVPAGASVVRMGGAPLS